MLLKITGFMGENPKTIPRLIGDSYAQFAYNTRLDDGGLTPIRKSKFAYQLPAAPAGGYKTLYRHNGDWMAWGSQVFLAPGPVAQDRLYIMGNGAPKVRIGGSEYPLRLAPPGIPLSASVSGTPTSNLGSTRLYVQTFVTQWGEESEPSPISNEVYWQPGQTVTLTNFAQAAAGRGITTQRIYRAQTSSTGTLLYFIAERAVSTAAFVDNVPLDASQEALPSADYNPPPDNLTGLISLPNGMMAAFRGKQLYFCEPYKPHAWPEKYILTTDYSIVGLGAFGNSIAVVTTGNPYLVTGTSPDTMSMEKLELNLPCINSNGIVDLGYSVVYPSHDGLVSVSSNGPQLIPLFTRDDWLRMNPYNMTAGQYNGRYITRFNYANAQGLELKGSFIIDLTGTQPFLIRTDANPDAMYYDLPTGKLYMLQGNIVSEWDAEGAANAVQSWRSKLFVLPKPTNFGAIKVDSDEGITPEQVYALEQEAAQVRTSNSALFGKSTLQGELNGSPLDTFSLNGDILAPIPTISQQVSVNIIANGKTVATIGRLNRMARLPSGFLADRWEILVSGDTQISQIILATTGDELSGA